MLYFTKLAARFGTEQGAAKRAGTYMDLRFCAVIPSRNHYTALGQMISALRAQGVTAFIIDDASDEPARSVIADLHAPADGVEVIRLDQNQGKGGAVTSGLRHAFQRGFTHAVQVDADGQHDIEALPSLIEVAVRSPDALISGRPIFDPSVPRHRVVFRWLTHVWVWVETLSTSISDSMCGFRVYPLKATVAVLNSEKVGRRMDFDPEIMVRMFWRGIPVVQVPVRVVYPEGNQSNFRMLHDNVLITRMHAKLVCTMLWRLPSILRNRRSIDRGSEHWASIRERGAYLGLRLLALAFKLLGRRGCLAMMFPVVTYFYLTRRTIRRHSIAYLRRLHAYVNIPPPTWVDSFRHYLSFASKALDAFIAWSAHEHCGPVRIVGGEELDGLAAKGVGVLLIVSHLGNSELSRARLAERFRADINVLVYTKHAARYNRLIRSVRDEVERHTIQVTDIGPEVAIALSERVDRGEWIAIAGDRTPTTGQARTSRAPFLGEDAAFSHGPYVLAALMGCPVYLMFCLREANGHTVYFERFAERISLPRHDRQTTLDGLVNRYARRLEYYCLRAPLQFYNFYDFWAVNGDDDVREPRRREKDQVENLGRA
jgi:predicted LPLAT superfamily acyltransferase